MTGYNNALSLILLPLAVTLAAIIYNTFKKRGPAPLPPGPKGFPLVGNVTDIPKSQPWVTFAKWGDQYGGIVHVNALGKSIIILNDPNVAMEMIDKKAKIYSDRPTFVLAGELVGWDEGPGLVQFDRNGPFSDYRRYYAHYMGSRGKVAESFSHILQDSVGKLLNRLLDNPTKWNTHVKLYAASNVLYLAYGYKVEKEDDEMLAIASNAMDEFSELTLSGSQLVDLFPILRYVPSWFPGAQWKRNVPKYKANLDRMTDAPFDWAEQQMNADSDMSAFVYQKLAIKDELTPKQMRLIRVTASSMYGAGSDTSISAIQSFFLSMVLYPSVQSKAQAEIDKVIGKGRLPTLEDRPNLPYVEALYWEVLRCYPIAPLAIPHVVSEDDVHNGYFIPKGAVIIPNVWKFMKDPRMYHNSETFSPERFLPSDGYTPEVDPRNYVFGFGRRICPGRHLGDAAMWTAMVSVLASFAISPVVKDGKPVLPKPTFKEGTVTHLEPFECIIKPRSAYNESLVRVLGER